MKKPAAVRTVLEKRKSCAIMRSEPLQAEAEPIYCTEFSGEKQYDDPYFICMSGKYRRSPMAEFVFRELVRREGLEDRITAESAATSTEALGCNVHAGARQKLQEEGIPFAWRQARQIERRDYARFDHLIGMETRNVSAMRRAFGGDPEGKIAACWIIPRDRAILPIPGIQMTLTRPIVISWKAAGRCWRRCAGSCSKTPLPAGASSVGRGVLYRDSRTQPEAALQLLPGPDAFGRL